MNISKEIVRYDYADFTKRMYIEMSLADKFLNTKKNVTFLVDTGSTTVSILAQELGLNTRQESYIKSNCTPKNHEGIVAGSTIQYYIYNVSEFRLGRNIILKDFPIHITFDPNAKYNLLGMSFLKLFNIYIASDKKIIVFNSFNSTEQIVTGQESAKDIENSNIPEILADADLSKSDIEITDKDLQAYLINKKVTDTNLSKQ